jgi:shikimate dehydrogenase
MLHGHWLRHYGLAGTYGREAVAPVDLADFVRRMPALGYVGANVTIPHKEAMLGLCEADDHARAVGAVNTIWFVEGRLRGTNTDVEGFLGALDAEAPDWRGRTGRALVLGAGGGGRAVAYGLRQRGIPDIRIANRTRSKAETLAADIGGIAVEDWAAVPEWLEGTDLLVNTTACGMNGHDDLDLQLGRMPAGATVADIVYVPLQTGLLARAEAAGLRTVDGLSMLLHQAVRGFELWFGLRPAVTAELYELLATDITGRA